MYLNVFNTDYMNLRVLVTLQYSVGMLSITEKQYMLKAQFRKLVELLRELRISRQNGSNIRWTLDKYFIMNIFLVPCWWIPVFSKFL
jgi:hypothetical protein